MGDNKYQRNTGNYTLLNRKTQNINPLIIYKILTSANDQFLCHVETSESQWYVNETMAGNGPKFEGKKKKLFLQETFLIKKL